MADWHQIQQLTDGSQLIGVSGTGSPPEKYLVTYQCLGLVKTPAISEPSLSSFHQLEIYLHLNYPRVQPRLTWLTEIFHPNILSPSQNGGVCIGAWTPAESLTALIIRIGEMVQYKSYNSHDPLDPEAAAWTLQHADLLPIDQRQLTSEPPAPCNVHAIEYIEVAV